MYIDYVTLLLVNAAAFYFILAAYVYKGMDDVDQAKWAFGFGISGAIALIFGTTMTVTWPLPGPYDSAFGELSVLLGITLIAATIAISTRSSLTAVAGYAFFAGIAAVVVGIRFLDLRLTMSPIPSGAGLILSGLAGVFALPVLIWFRNNRLVRIVGALDLLAAGVIWAVTAYAGYWEHLEGFSKWVPATMRAVSGH